MSRLFSPYQLNPWNYNPLRQVLEQSVDFERLHAACPIKLYLSATNVRTGKVRLFENGQITADAVMASACLPFMFQAVEIDGEAYWDGGYMGNPAIYPLIYNCDSRDVVVVHINPMCRPEVPRTAHDILNRINEISFNSSLMREMRAIAFVTRLIDDGKLVDHTMRRMLIHAISADGVMQKLSATSKLNADWEFLTHLRDDGREHAEAWLAGSFDRLGSEFDDRYRRHLPVDVAVPHGRGSASSLQGGAHADHRRPGSRLRAQPSGPSMAGSAGRPGARHGRRDGGRDGRGGRRRGHPRLALLVLWLRRELRARVPCGASGTLRAGQARRLRRARRWARWWPTGPRRKVPWASASC